MSCFMMSSRSLTVIAKYLAAAANAKGPGTMLEGVATISTPETMDEVLRKEGCYDSKYGMFDASRIYALLARTNAESVAVRYGGTTSVRAMDEDVPLDRRESTRRVWLAKLYNVCSCYLYQITEGDVSDSRFYKEFEKWLNKMAEVLARYLVDEAYGDEGGGSAHWGKF